MGDLGDSFRAHREHRKKVHADWNRKNRAIIDASGVAYEDRGEALLFRIGGIVADFYPSTGRWREPVPFVAGQWVVCVDTGLSPALAVGNRYRVIETLPNLYGNLRLEGLERYSFAARLFKPEAPAEVAEAESAQGSLAPQRDVPNGSTMRVEPHQQANGGSGDGGASGIDDVHTRSIATTESTRKENRQPSPSPPDAVAELRAEVAALLNADRIRAEIERSHEGRLEALEKQLRELTGTRDPAATFDDPDMPRLVKDALVDLPPPAWQWLRNESACAKAVQRSLDAALKRAESAESEAECARSREHEAKRRAESAEAKAKDAWAQRAQAIADRASAIRRSESAEAERDKLAAEMERYKQACGEFADAEADEPALLAAANSVGARIVIEKLKLQAQYAALVEAVAAVKRDTDKHGSLLNAGQDRAVDAALLSLAFAALDALEQPPSAGGAGGELPADPLHPDGRCTCSMEGRCKWCQTHCLHCGYVEKGHDDALNGFKADHAFEPVGKPQPEPAELTAEMVVEAVREKREPYGAWSRSETEAMMAVERYAQQVARGRTARGVLELLDARDRTIADLRAKAGSAAADAVKAYINKHGLSDVPGGFAPDSLIANHLRRIERELRGAR